MLTSDPRAADARSRAWLLAVILATAAGCRREASTCDPTQVEGCLPACDRGQIEACRWLGDSLAQSKNGVVAGAMLLERACLAGDAAACKRLESLPVAHARATASASASAPPIAPLPPQSCPAGMESVALAGPAAPGGQVAALAPSAAAMGSGLAPARPAPTPALGPAVGPLAIDAQLPPGAGPEAHDLARRCDHGEGVACTRLGDRYDEGLGVARTPGRAVQLHTLGCERSDANGCRLAGQALARGPQGDVTRGIDLLRRGCMGSDAGSCATLGEIALSGVSPSLTPSYGPAQLQRACTNAYAPACRRLASLLRDGKLVPRDTDAAERIDARSLDLVGQGCKAGTADACLLLGLWRERPGLLGEDATTAPRTTDRPSLEGAIEAYRGACQAGSPRGCARAADLLAQLGRAPEAGELWTQLDRTCQAGDGASCLEAVERASERAGDHVELLHKACEQHLARACVVLGRWLDTQPAPGPVNATTLLSDACQLGDAEGCEGMLAIASRRGETRVEATVDVCRRFGGGACVPVAAAVRASGDQACASRLLARACLEAPAPTPAGCAAAAEVLASVDPSAAAEADRRACAGPASSPSPALAAACLRHAQAEEAAGHHDESHASAQRACTAGSAVGCRLVASDRRFTGKSPGPEAHRAAYLGCQRGDRESCKLWRELPAPPPSGQPPLPAWANVNHREAP